MVMVYVQEEDLLVEMLGESGAELSSAAMGAQGAVKPYKLCKPFAENGTMTVFNIISYFNL